MPIGITSGYKNSLGEDIGEKLVPKSYLIDRYPELLDNFRFAGLWTWGNNTNGQLGDNAFSHKSSPIQTIAGGTNWKSITGVYYRTVAIKADGTLWSWGDNLYGQLGDNTTVDKSSPIQTVSSGTNWKLAAGGFYNTSAIKTDGTLWLWGHNSYGQLGDSTQVNKSSPIQTISGGTNWKLVTGGMYHTAAIKNDGTLWTWGRATYGQLGDNTIAHKSSPIQTIAGGSDWKLVTGGLYHTVAIKTDGTLWSWGYNFSGQLGNNATLAKSSPVQTVAGGTNWKSVAAGSYHTAAIKTDGTLWLWGHNNYGQLGDNTRFNKSSPIQNVSTGTNWRLIANGLYHTLAIKTDGTLWTWGRNHLGQLGNNTIAHQSSPIQTVAGGTNWKSVTGGYYHTAAIRDDSEDLL